jgi:hypothetical protein
MLTKAPVTELQDTVDGRSLSYQLRRATPRQRATWAKRLGRFTRKQASAICVSWWQQASIGDRVDFVRACGVSEVWDALSTAVV